MTDFIKNISKNNEACLLLQQVKYLFHKIMKTGSRSIGVANGFHFKIELIHSKGFSLLLRSIPVDVGPLLDPLRRANLYC